MLLQDIMGCTSPDPPKTAYDMAQLITEQLCDTETSVGVEIELENLAVNWKRHYIPNSRSIDQAWSREQDGSLRGPSGTQYEFKFHKPLKGAKVNKAIEQFYKDFESESLELHSNLRTSMHVHVNMLSLSVNQILLVLLAGAVLDKHIFSTTNDSRPYTGYCGSNASALVASISQHIQEGVNKFKLTTFSKSRYNSLNTQALQKYGTLEFRHFATPDTKEIAIQQINACLMVRLVGIEAYNALAQEDEDFSLTSALEPTAFYNAIATKAAEKGIPAEQLMQIEEFTQQWELGFLREQPTSSERHLITLSDELAHMAIPHPVRDAAAQQANTTSTPVSGDSWITLDDTPVTSWGELPGPLQGETVRNVYSTASVEIPQSRPTRFPLEPSFLVNHGSTPSVSLRTALQTAQEIGIISTVNGVNYVADWAFITNGPEHMIVVDMDNQPNPEGAA